MAVAARVRRARGVAWPRVVAWAWLPTLLLIVVAVLTVTPVVTALVAGFRDAPPGRPGAITWESIRASLGVMADPDVLRILWTTVWLSTVRAVLALALAVVLAWIIARTDCPFRNRLEFLLILSFFFPLLGKVLGWALLLSPQKGYLNQLLRLVPFFAGDTGPLDIFSYGGLIFVSVTGWATLLAIFLIPAFRNMDAALEESARMCGASPRRTVMRILVPLLRPAILAAFILSLTRLLSSFETEVFLGTSSGIYVLTNKIYERMVQIFPPDFRTGMTMAIMLLVITFALVLVNWRFLGKRDYTTVSGRGYSARPMALGRLRWVAFGFVVLFFVVTGRPARGDADPGEFHPVHRAQRLRSRELHARQLAADAHAPDQPSGADQQPRDEHRRDHGGDDSLLARLLRGDQEPLQRTAATRPGGLGAVGGARRWCSASGSCGRFFCHRSRSSMEP